MRILISKIEIRHIIVGVVAGVTAGVETYRFLDRPVKKIKKKITTAAVKEKVMEELEDFEEEESDE